MELLDRYRSVVRREVARYDGAEIRTERDSFYVVYPSATLAVRCALAVRAAVTEANRTEPDRPIDVGIGVHAGETVDTAAGPVGSAVNLASRVASRARSREVLVTDTVRQLARGNEPATFRGRGRHRLRGIAEPISLFSVTTGTAGAPSTGRRAGRRPWVAAGAAVALLGIVTVAG